MTYHRPVSGAARPATHNGDVIKCQVNQDPLPLYSASSAPSAVNLLTLRNTFYSLLSVPPALRPSTTET